MWRLGVAIITLSLLTLPGCKKEEGLTGPEEGGGGGGSGTVNLVVEGVVGPTGAWVTLTDTTGQPITNATVTVNGRSLSYLWQGVYYDSTIRYQKGQTYTLQVEASGYGSAEATLQAPQIDSVKITQPSSGAQITPGDPIPVSWEYYGGQNNGTVAVSFSYRGSGTVYSSPPMDGSTTRHTIPDSATVQEGDASITVHAGAYTILSGLPGDSSFFAVGVWDEVEVTVGQGGGGGTGTWSGTLQGTLNGQSVSGNWSYTGGYFSGTIGNTPFLGQIPSWPPQNSMVYTQTGLQLSFTGTVQGDRVSGTWEVVAGGSGSGTWEGSRQ